MHPLIAAIVLAWTASTGATGYFVTANGVPLPSVSQPQQALSVALPATLTVTAFSDSATSPPSAPLTIELTKATLLCSGTMAQEFGGNLVLTSTDLENWSSCAPMQVMKGSQFFEMANVGYTGP